MRRFYSERLIGDTETFSIKGQEANHITNVIRLKSGDELIAFDGSGYDYRCVIESVSKGNVDLKVLSKEYSDNEPETHITLYSASIKKDKIDFAFQKSCELGIDSFFVYNASRSVRIVKDAEKLTERLNRIAVEVSKQCGRSRMPEVGFVRDTRAVADRISRHDCVIFAYEEDRTTHISEVISSDAKDIGIVIGPEGGFEPEEAEFLISRGARACSLGKLILRAETAAVFAVSSVLFAKERI